MPYLIYNIHVSRLLVDRRNSYNRWEASDGGGTAHGGGGKIDRTASVASRASRRRFFVSPRADESTDADRKRAMRSLTCHNLRASSSSIFSDAFKYDISPSNELLFRWQSARAAEAVNYECD